MTNIGDAVQSERGMYRMTETWVEENPLTARRWEEYGFDLSDLEKYQLYDISAQQASELEFTQAANGIYIQYPEDRDSRIRYYRTGFQAQTEMGKYGQRRNTPPKAYYPLWMVDKWNELKNDRNLPVLLVEGEFKAVAVDNIVNNEVDIRVLPLGLGGVFNWQSKKLGIDLLPGLKEVQWGGRQVLIGFDMDMASNPFVALALGRLFNKLTNLGAVCRVLTWDGDKGKGIDDYLCKSLTRMIEWNSLVAQAQVPSHVLIAAELNKRFAYVEREQRVWDLQNDSYINVRNFAHEFFTEKIKVQTGVKQTQAGPIPVMKEMSIGAYWLTSPVRSAVSKLQFLPGGQGIEEIETAFSDKRVRLLNTWHGWGCDLNGNPLKPKKGNVKPFYDFIYATFSNEKQAYAQYLIKRLAWMFQQPQAKHPTWIYLIGAPYQGKSSLIKLISALVGLAYTSNIDESALKGSFSEWRAEKMLVTLDDSSVKDRQVTQQLLKRMTTEDNSRVNKKYQSEYTAQSFFTFFFAANGIEALLEHDDRRALVLLAECKWEFAKGEWAEFDEWRQSRDGQQALLHHFLHEVKLEAGFREERPPLTHARELVIQSGASAWDEFLHGIATTMGPIKWRSPATKDLREWQPTIFSTDMLRALYNLTSAFTDDKFEIRNGSLSAKLARFGARHCIPPDSTDARGRIFLQERQLTLWTWDKKWVNRPREEYILEYTGIIKNHPELDPKHKF